MQNLPVYLYRNILHITLDLDPTTKGVNRVMYQRDLKIQKGIKNQVRVQFKNSDQKPIKIYSTQTFVFSMFDAINKRLIVEKPLQVLDNSTSTKGLALLTLDESDTLNLDRTSYQYVIKMADSDGSYTPAYANTYYGMAGTLHLQHDVFPELRDSIEIKNWDKRFNGDTMLYEQYSGDIYASPEFNGNHALHTAAFYFTNYKGTVSIQATLDNSPGPDGNYDTVFTKTYDGFSGIDHVNFNGVFSYVRFKHIPKKGPTDPDNDNPAYYGSFDRVLYRS